MHGQPYIKKRDYLEDQGVDRWIILRCIFRRWFGGGMDYIDQDQDRDR